MHKSDLRKAAKKALKIRAKFKIPLDSSFCVIDLADKLGVEVRFVDLKSLEGAYLKESKTILVSTYRPEGRIRFSCAHELGHFVFGHGDHFDELVEKVKSGEGRFEEQLSEAFASFLLIPETTVRSGFVKRRWDINSASPIEFFVVANWLGIGYTTILNHLRYGLNMIDQKHFKQLINIQPKSIKSDMCGFNVSSNLLVVDQFWNGRPVDMQVGDYLFTKANSVVEKDYLKIINGPKKHIWVAQKPGITRMLIDDHNNAVMVRIRRKEYIGRAVFRHLEEG